MTHTVHDSESLVRLQHPESGIAEIILNRPDCSNALNLATWDALYDTLTEVAANDQDRVVVLCGAGESFTSGADLRDSAAMSHDSYGRLQRVAAAALALHELPKPTIAKVRGRAIGGGMSLALGCDFVVAANNTTFWPVFSQRGLTMDAGASWLLPRLIGLRLAKELVFLGEPIAADRAERIGLITQACHGEQLDSTVAELARRMNRLSPQALRWSKELLHHSVGGTLAEALDDETRYQARALSSADFGAAVAAYRAERRSTRDMAPAEDSAVARSPRVGTRRGDPA